MANTSNDTRQRHETFLRYADYAIGTLIVTVGIIGIRNLRTKIANKRVEISEQYARETERQKRIHQQWIQQQTEQYQQQLHQQQYIDRIERARRAEFVEETYRHAEHNWSYSKRYKPPHYTTWGDTQQDTQYTFYNYSDNNYNNTIQPLNAKDVNARALLGIKIDVSNADLNENAVKKAYRQKAKTYHPDVNGGNSNKFNEVTDAYNVLMNAISIQKENKQRDSG